MSRIEKQGTGKVFSSTPPRKYSKRIRNAGSVKVLKSSSLFPSHTDFKSDRVLIGSREARMAKAAQFRPVSAKTPATALA